MKAIVSGGMGFIGHNLVRKLLDKKWRILVLDDLSSGKSWNKWPNAQYLIRALEKSFSSENTIIDKAVKDFDPDVIFHVAAIPRVSYSTEHPYQTTQSNVLSTVAVLDAARKHGKKNIRVVYSSSSSIYGGAKVLPTPVDCPPDPQSPYAMQKWQGEEWCRLYSQLYNLDTVCLRYFNVIGPYSYYGGAYSTVLSAWLYNLYVQPDSQPFLEGDGTQSRDFCCVDNVTNANMLAAEYRASLWGEAFNVAQGKRTSLLECKEILEKFSGKRLELEIRPPRKGDVKDTLADITLTKSVFGYSPDTDFEQQVKRMADWYENSYRED